MFDYLTFKQRSWIVKSILIFILSFIFFVGTMMFLVMFEFEIYATLGQYGLGDGTFEIPLLSFFSYIISFVLYLFCLKWIVKCDLASVIKENVEKEKEKNEIIHRRK